MKKKIKFVLNGSGVHYLNEDGNGKKTLNFTPTKILVYNEETGSSRYISQIKLDEMLGTKVLTGLSEKNSQYVVPLSSIDRIEADSYSMNGTSWVIYVSGLF